MKHVNVIVCLLPFLLSHCSTGKTDEVQVTHNDRPVRTVAVETVTMKEDTLEETVRVVGAVEALEDATISSEVSGRVHYLVPLGKQVEPGEVIARLDDRLLQAQYESARASYELAVDTYRRQQALFADSIISELQYNNIRTQRDQARAMYEQVRKQLLDTRIEAPFRGRVEERFVRTGELINPGMPVVRIVNTEKVKIVAGVPDRFAPEIREGSHVEIRFIGYENPGRQSTISFAGNVIDADTRTYRIEVELPNPDGSLKPEMVADVKIVRRSIPNTLVIPRTAIVRDEHGPNVFIVRYEGTHPVAELVPVRTGVSSGLLTQIIDGIAPGDEVVVAGHRNLNPGDRLDILNNDTSAQHVRSLQSRNRNH